MVAPSPNMLSEVANHLGRFITQNVSGGPRVIIGPPIDAIPTDPNSEPVVNLFFYKLSPSGFYADASSLDPFQIRIQCLITTFGTEGAADDSEDSVLSEGETNLRLLGSIIQQFHRTPVQHVALPGGGPLAQTALQIIFMPLSVEELNQIWSTQGDTTLRTSLSYELALAPIVSEPMPQQGPRVSDAGPSVASDLVPGNLPIIDAVPAIQFAEKAGESHWSAETWMRPANIFVTRFEGADPVQTGAPSLGITLTLPAGISAPHRLTVRQIQPVDEVLSTATIAGGGNHIISLPERNGDFMIYVESHKTDIDTHPVSVRSNILTVTLSGINRPEDDGGGP